MSRSTEQWAQLGRQKHRYFYFYEEKVLDLTDFIQFHPGGKKALLNYTNKDITDILFKVYPHKKETTLDILLKYRIGTLSNPRRLQPKGSSESEAPKEKKKVCFQKKFLCEEENDGQTDDSEITFSKKRSASKKKSGNSSGSSKAGTSRDSPLKSTKSGKKSHSPSLKALKSSKEKLFEQDLNYQSPAKKQKGSKQTEASSLVLQEDFDEEKPVFLVPVLRIKHMNEL